MASLVLVFVTLIWWSLTFIAAFGPAFAIAVVGTLAVGVLHAAQRPEARAAWRRVRTLAILGLLTPPAIIVVGTFGALARDHATRSVFDLFVGGIACLAIWTAVDVFIILRRSAGHRLGYGLIGGVIVMWSLSAWFIAGMAISGNWI